MKMKEIHEKPFVAELLRNLVPDASFINGFGQDASVLDVGLGDTAVALKIDRAAKPVAALRGWTDYTMWGRLAVTANCSDLLAVGARPTGFMLSISVPGDWDAHDAKSVVYGAQAECQKNSVSFLGGDTKEAGEPHVVGCAVGLLERSKILNRRQGCPGDLLVLAGPLGGFVGAYLHLDAGVGDAGREDYLQYLSYPTARWREAAFMNKNGLAVSATDLSDGLYDGLLNVAGEGAGVLLELDQLPYHRFARQAEMRFGVSLINLSFSVGDWSILYAVPAARRNFVEHAKASGLDLSIIGIVSEQPGVRGKSASTQKLYEVEGIVNQHFADRLEDEGTFLSKMRTNIGLKRIG